VSHLESSNKNYPKPLNVYNNKVNSISFQMFLEQVEQRVTTTWTTGRQVGVLFTSPLKHYVRSPPWAAGIVSQRYVHYVQQKPSAWNFLSLKLEVM
jgi:hypothetical protein